MDPLIGVAGGVLTLIGVIVSAVLTRRSSDRKLASDAGQQMIDQHQEDIAALRSADTAKEQRIRSLERQMRIQGDYIGQLRRHIADGNPPPPPPWPQGLIT